MYRSGIISIMAVIACWFGFRALPAHAEVNWHGGESPPSLTWVINPNEPNVNEIIYFSGPTEVYSNDCFARMAMGGSPTLTINPNEKTVELWFQPPAPEYCIAVWAPVCGLEGHFGPLAGGDWLFFCESPMPGVLPWPNFYIQFKVSSLAVLQPNGGEILLADSIYTINWTDFRSGSGCPGNYLLKYSTNNGESWTPIDSNSVSNTCSYDWLVPTVDSNECLIQIVDANDPNIVDTSDDLFYIYECQGPIIGDLDNNCYVDFLDLAVLSLHWLECGNPYDPDCGD